ncbi:sugar ABC transporter [Zobellella denitrificans]|uniref:ABC transporter ATP-binding protein n=1 Tax=Zobellella TaxID=347533 RepID=UPI000B8C6946|nr:ABC transporter ATP-binding protein [Zobellella denitrificans]OXS14802.1 sugar ABC transporter [Zobellella denitrificans]
MVNTAIQQEQAHKVLSVNALIKSYGGADILKSVSVDMDEGDFLVLVGPSGCGKSTLLNCIAGLEEATGGQILIDGRDVTRVPPRDRDIAMVFQSYALYPTMTVAENIAFGMKIRKVPKEEQQRKTREVAQMLQIDHLLDRKPSQLSGGQRQRVAMGRALVREPVLFLFDEPLSNLDAKLRVEMRAEIHHLHKQTNASIVYVTHDQIEAMTLGTKIVVLRDGHIQQVGTPQQIYDEPANMFVANFMGTPPMNLLPARVELSDAGVLLEVCGPNGFTLVDSRATERLRDYQDKEVVVGLRPEALHPYREARHDHAIHLPVANVESSGSDTFVQLQAGEHRLNARLGGRSRVAEGEPLALAAEMDHVCYFDPQTELLIK